MTGFPATTWPLHVGPTAIPYVKQLYEGKKHTHEIKCFCPHKQLH